MPEHIMIDLGRVAYEGYWTVADGRSPVDGSPLPAWDEQRPEVRECWRAGADAVRMWLDQHPPTPPSRRTGW